MLSQSMPVMFVPHGGGPLPLMGDASHAALARYIRELPSGEATPEAIVMISAHWEEDKVHVANGTTPDMVFDYYGFPADTYAYRYPAPGAPVLASDIAESLREAGIDVQLNPQRGFDHGTFVPLLMMYPEADIPVVQVSLVNHLDPEAHIALGEALAPFREKGALIIGSGMSFHNMRAFFEPSLHVEEQSERFDRWLWETLVSPNYSWQERRERLANWHHAPHARYCHPREEHLIPLLVCFGAAKQTAAAERNFDAYLMGTKISGFIWH